MIKETNSKNYRRNQWNIKQKQQGKSMKPDTYSLWRLIKLIKKKIENTSFTNIRKDSWNHYRFYKYLNNNKGILIKPWQKKLAI